MRHYVILMKLAGGWEDEVPELPGRMTEVTEAWRVLTGDGTMTLLATMGEYDLAAVAESRSEKDHMAEFALILANTGWVSAMTMPGYTSSEVTEAIEGAKLAVSPRMKIHFAEA
jgi:uncharacterized protein with GYD domain